MSSVIISGDTSGAITVSAPAVAGTNTLTLQAATATSSINTRATAVASTSGTAIDFTALPSWIKRITVMFSGVSTSGTSNFLVQIGAGSVTTSGYVSGGLAVQAAASSSAGVTSTAGFIAVAGINGATQSQTGTVTLLNITSNTWIAASVTAESSDGNRTTVASGTLALGGTLDRVRITTVNGTDTFDAGSVNILYEG
jgi:hypothetical protein